MPQQIPVPTQHVAKLADGYEYQFAPVSAKILGEFNRWVNQQEHRKPLTTLLGVDQLMLAAQAPAGMIWLLWRCLKAHHPKVTESEVGDLIPDLDLLREIFEQLMPHGGSDESEDDEGEAGNPTG